MPTIRIAGSDGLPEDVHLLREEPETDQERISRWKAAEDAALDQERQARRRGQRSGMWLVALAFALLALIQWQFNWPL